MSSISQNVHADALPDLRNLGVIARILLGVHLLALGAAIVAEPTWSQALMHLTRMAALLEPLLLLSIVALYLGAPWLARLPYAHGCAMVLLIEVALAAVVHALVAQTDLAPGNLSRTLALTAGTALGLLAYFRLRARAFSPALAEARLQALQARIRPHFLFNSLNAVLSLVRRDPRRAEQALEDLADLFRELMADGRRFVRLADEIALLERYAGIEKLRLGERLRIVWELDGAPSDALLPPMVLQPLLENAVYHGVETATGASEVVVRIGRRGDRVLAEIESPFRGDALAQRAGNRMALENIRERLRLFFDAEARLDSVVEGNCYRVQIEMPYKSRAAGMA
jgi:two-component system sensor histidine kinase AlgZ